MPFTGSIIQKVATWFCLCSVWFYLSQNMLLRVPYQGTSFKYCLRSFPTLQRLISIKRHFSYPKIQLNIFGERPELGFFYQNFLISAIQHPCRLQIRLNVRKKLVFFPENLLVYFSFHLLFPYPSMNRNPA